MILVKLRALPVLKNHSESDCSEDTDESYDTTKNYVETSFEMPWT